MLLTNDLKTSDWMSKNKIETDKALPFEPTNCISMKEEKITKMTNVIVDHGDKMVNYRLDKIYDVSQLLNRLMMDGLVMGLTCFTSIFG
jgi:hypothetical protein